MGCLYRLLRISKAELSVYRGPAGGLYACQFHFHAALSGCSSPFAFGGNSLVLHGGGSVTLSYVHDEEKEEIRQEDLCGAIATP